MSLRPDLLYVLRASARMRRLSARPEAEKLRVAVIGNWRVARGINALMIGGASAAQNRCDRRRKHRPRKEVPGCALRVGDAGSS